MPHESSTAQSSKKRHLLAKDFARALKVEVTSGRSLWRCIGPREVRGREVAVKLDEASGARKVAELAVFLRNPAAMIVNNFAYVASALTRAAPSGLPKPMFARPRISEGALAVFYF
jgi:hypothetical protein